MNKRKEKASQLKKVKANLHRKEKANLLKPNPLQKLLLQLLKLKNDAIDLLLEIKFKFITI